MARRRLTGVLGWLKVKKYLRAIHFAVRLRMVVSYKRAACCLLQRSFRLTRNIELLKQFVHSSRQSALLLQRVGRGYLGRSVVEFRRQSIIKLQRLFRKRIAMCRLKQLVSEYKTIALDCCAVQHEAIRLLSVLPELTKHRCSMHVERYHLGKVLVKHKMDLRMGYLFASIGGSLQLDKFFRVSQAQLRQFLRDIGVMECAAADPEAGRGVALTRSDCDICMAQGLQWTRFMRFDTGAFVNSSVQGNSADSKDSKGAQGAATGTRQYDVDSFLEVLVAISKLRFPAEIFYSDTLDLLCRLHIAPYVASFQGSGSGVVAFSKLNASVSSSEHLGLQIETALKSKAVTDLSKQKEINQIFKVVAGSDQMVNAREYFRMMKTSRVVDSTLSWSMLITTFLNSTPQVYQTLQGMFKVDDLENQFQIDQSEFFPALATCALLKYKDYKKLKTPDARVAKLLDDICSKLKSLKIAYDK